jgi:hypothetical protein
VKEGDILGDLVVDGMIILGSILEKYGVKLWTRLVWLMIGTTVVNTKMNPQFS